MMSGCVAALTMAVLSIAMVHFQEKSYKANLEKNALSIVSALSEATTSSILAEDFETLLSVEFSRVIRDRSDIRYLVLREEDGSASIYYPDGQWTRTTLNGDMWRPAADQSDRGIITSNELSDGRCFHFSRRIAFSGDQTWGWIHVGLALKDYNENVRGVYRVTGIVAGGTLLLAALVSYFFARNLTEPILSLQRFAQRVAAGAGTARVDITSQDEIGNLAESINTMIGSLQTSQDRLRKSLEEQTSLREKDVLLREIHHRVKNNMQMLSSLMRLQSRRADTEEARDILRQSEARIRSMGLIHEKLYQSESISTIDMHGYLNTLTGELMRMQTTPGSRREVRLTVHGIGLSIDTALPCGLIVTELVQNCLKYAFPDGRDGVILVSLSKTSEGNYSLIVWDNGVGFGDDFDPITHNSLGMRLVRMLTDQLHGTLTVSGQQGTRTEISFKETQYQNRL